MRKWTFWRERVGRQGVSEWESEYASLMSCAQLRFWPVSPACKDVTGLFSVTPGEPCPDVSMVTDSPSQRWPIRRRGYYAREYNSRHFHWQHIFHIGGFVPLNRARTVPASGISWLFLFFFVLDGWSWGSKPINPGGQNLNYLSLSLFLDHK